MAEGQAVAVATWEVPGWAEHSEPHGEAVIHVRRVGGVADLDGDELWVEVEQREEWEVSDGIAAITREPALVRVAGFRVSVERAIELAALLMAASDTVRLGDTVLVEAPRVLVEAAGPMDVEGAETPKPDAAEASRREAPGRAGQRGRAEVLRRAGVREHADASRSREPRGNEAPQSAGASRGKEALSSAGLPRAIEALPRATEVLTGIPEVLPGTTEVLGTDGERGRTA